MRVCACPPNNNGSVWSYLYSDGVHSSYGHTANFNYDALNRLSSASATGQSTYSLSFDYTHDGSSGIGPYGNAHCTSTGGGCNPNLSFSSSTNRITGYNYDAAGHVIADGVYTYGWDGDGRLSSVSTSSGVLYNVVYYPDGHVAQEAQPNWDTSTHPSAASHDYSYDLFGNIAIHLFGTYGSGFNGIETISLGDRWLAQYNENNPAGTYFAHPNELGTNVAWTNWAGAQTTDQTFYPWGGDWQTSGSPEPHFARMDTREPFLGLDLTANRMYNSNLGRWLTPDPAGKGAVHLDDPQTWNMYAYTRNNFTTLTDPTGLLEANPGSTAQEAQEQSEGNEGHDPQNNSSGGATAAEPGSSTDESQAGHSGPLCLVQDWLDVIEVSGSYGLSLGVNGQAGIAEGRLGLGSEVEGTIGLGGGNGDIEAFSGARASGQVGPAEGEVQAGVTVSYRDGASIGGEAHGSVGSAGASVKVDSAGVHTSAGAGANKDAKLGAHIQAGLGVGVAINLSQARRAAHITASAVADTARYVASRLAGTPTLVVP